MAKFGQDCIRANKNFIKGYFRLATAQKALKNYTECIKSLESGLAIDSTSPDLKRMKKEVNELLRGDQVNSYCNKVNCGKIEFTDWRTKCCTNASLLLPNLHMYKTG